MLKSNLDFCNAEVGEERLVCDLEPAEGLFCGKKYLGVTAQSRGKVAERGEKTRFSKAFMCSAIYFIMFNDQKKIIPTIRKNL